MRWPWQWGQHSWGSPRSTGFGSLFSGHYWACEPWRVEEPGAPGCLAHPWSHSSHFRVLRFLVKGDRTSFLPPAIRKEASSRPEVNFTEVGGLELWFEQSTSFRLSTSLAPYYLQFALLLTLDFTLFCWCSDFSLPIQVEPPWRYPSPTRISINTCRRAAQCPKSCSFPQDLFEVQQNHSLETWDQKVRKCPVP